eukprot:8266049-Lingulodinium_polyedra.AAC.1
MATFAVDPVAQAAGLLRDLRTQVRRVANRGLGGQDPDSFCATFEDDARRLGTFVAAARGQHLGGDFHNWVLAQDVVVALSAGPRWPVTLRPKLARLARVLRRVVVPAPGDPWPEPLPQAQPEESSQGPSG